uniref:Integrase catalytic domain-containing protein n=1 Tax=Trichogramma kaykai TaxID=54128 RepID=A0ABD2WYZ5_9HYME
MENYVLTTVTLGSGPSAFLANRTLRQLAEDEGEKYPLATPIVRQEMYMDDVLSGAFDIKVAMQKRDQLNALFSAGGFTLAKWMTNDDQMLHSFGPDSLAKESTLKVGLGFSVLGLVWEPRTDVFRFNVSIEPLTNPITKRKVLSCIAGMFDPSGWIAPVLISMKIFMQSLWLLTKEWDTPLPASEVERWRAFERDLQVLATIVIPRWTGILSGTYLELHGFADASKFAYAAVLYVRVLYHGQARVTLLASKTKVAPLKTLSIPRLELCAAHLLAKLASSFIATEDFVTVPLYLWPNSKTILHWLHGIPARWPIFVANRCADVAHLTPRATWQYINTKQNPADLASRGSTAGALLDNKLWWHGPEALVATSQPWTATNFDNSNEATAKIETPERIALLQEVTPPPECEIIARFSSYSRMRRVLVYCLRFLKKLALKCNIKLSLQFESSAEEEITVDELTCATIQLCRMTQASYFSKEILLVKSGQRLSKGHCLNKLSPKIENGLLTVGGRLHNSLLSDDCKHLIILPTKSRLTTLLIDHMHPVTLHGGVQLIVSHLRQHYWIPRLKVVVSAQLRKCVVCLRYRAATASQRMADLPAVRVTPDRLFKSSGVDYAGPFMLKASRHRGSLSYKRYMAIFVCMVTKAVHLEAASSYDTASFIAALKRFVSRRGQCLHIYSDCGTNFVGADAQLRQMHRKGSAFYKSIFSHLSGEGITWHYNPPGSPHFGGLWESGVKSVKHHLKRMIGDTLLTYEEFATLLAQIEAILNSRPLTPLPEEPEPETVLTPAHPIIGESSFLIAEPPVKAEKIGALERWKRVTQLTQVFWEWWSKEYLYTLQKRNKWQLAEPNIVVGDIVLVKNESTPCARWPMAKVTAIHPGRDGLVRVATVATASGSYKRPIVKLVKIVDQPDE